MMVNTEVQKARVRALSARLMTMELKGYDIGSILHCSYCVAELMPEFAIACREPFSEMLTPTLEDFFGLHIGFFCLCGDNNRYPPPALGWEATVRYDPYRVGLAYLAAIGDVGPPDLRHVTTITTQRETIAA